jgi:hypothetical protein
MTEKPKRTAMSRTRLIVIGIIGTIVLVGLIAALTLGIVIPLTQPIVDAGTAFIETIDAQDFDAAYAMLAPELQSEVGANGLAEHFANADLSDWSYSQRSLRNGVGRLNGRVLWNGEATDFVLFFTKIDEQWRLMSYNFEPAG